MDFVIADEQIPIKVWGAKPVNEEGIEMVHLLHEGVFSQARNLANLPVAWKWICLMPDYHHGYGMPIGGVLATKNAVVPNAVGVDIGCGMIAVQTEIPAESVSLDDLQALRVAVHQRVPVGAGKSGRQKDPRKLPEEMYSRIPETKSAIVSHNMQNAESSVGTLGGGNHFIEFQKDEEGALWVMLHSGSRNVGLRVCQHYHKVAQKYMDSFGIKLPDKDLAFLPHSVPEHDEYIHEMRWCMEFAECNRIYMLDSIFASMKEVLDWDGQIVSTIDTHHNFAATEHHYGENVMVHRKGAVKAEGLVTIPGSMSTASYICEGLKPQESFNSCAHGAGRAMSRSKANATITHEEAVEYMKDVVFGVRKGDYDEMQAAYKNVHAVVQSMPDLVEVVTKLTPLAVVKG